MATGPMGEKYSDRLLASTISAKGFSFAFNQSAKSGNCLLCQGRICASSKSSKAARGTSFTFKCFFRNGSSATKYSPVCGGGFIPRAPKYSAGTDSLPALGPKACQSATTALFSEVTPLRNWL